MEDLKKYTFDPANPKDFKAYKLLLNILKWNNNVMFTDDYFFMELYGEEIFTPDVVGALWDKPNNFHKLSIGEKLTIFEEQLSRADLNELISKKLSKKELKICGGLFNKVISIGEIRSTDNSEEEYPFDGIFTTMLTTSITNNVLRNIFLLEDRFHKYEEGENDPIVPIWGIDNYHLENRNAVFFVHHDNIKALNFFSFQRVSVLFIEEQHFSKFQIVIEKNKYLHPILLKETKDIHILFNILRQDLNQQTQIVEQKEISYLQKFQVHNYFTIKKGVVNDIGTTKAIYFVGENGDGKTLLLQALLMAMKGKHILTESDKSLTGHILQLADRNPTLQLTAIDTLKKNYTYKKATTNSLKNVFAYGAHRSKKATEHSERYDKYGYMTLFGNDYALKDPMAWLQYLHHKETAGEQPHISLALAKELLVDLLEEKVTINVSPDAVTFEERDSQNVEFDQLSDGYKSVLIWVADLVARLAENQPYVQQLQDFKGIVLVDELGLHLHPKWAYDISQKLTTKWFPNIQFFFTTHHLSIIQGAPKGAIFYKVYKEDGETKISDPITQKVVAPLMANGLLTAPFLFNLDSARTAAFDKTKQELDYSDDYLAGQIHRAIQKRLKQQAHATETDVLDWINEELDQFEEKANEQ